MGRRPPRLRERSPVFVRPVDLVCCLTVARLGRRATAGGAGSGAERPANGASGQGSGGGGVGERMLRRACGLRLEVTRVV